MADQDEQPAPQEPQGPQGPGASAAAPKTAGASALPAQITSAASSAASQASTALSSVFSLVNSNLAKARQFATETISKGEKTELSDEYRKLETQFGRVVVVVENLAKVSTMFIQPGIFTDVKLSVASTVDSTTISSLQPAVDKLRSVDLPKSTAAQSLGAHFAKNGQTLGADVAVGLALLKVGDAQAKLGDAKLQMNQGILDKFIKPLEALQNGPIRSAQAARRAVQNARAALDSAKLKLKNSPPAKADQARAELDSVQAQFDATIAQSMEQMQTVVDSNELLASVADFTQATLAYYRAGFELLEELAPEIDAMKAKQENPAA